MDQVFEWTYSISKLLKKDHECVKEAIKSLNLEKLNVINLFINLKYYSQKELR